MAVIEVRELGNDDIKQILERNNFAHLGCSRDNIPYVVPIHYGYDDPFIYLFTTQGKKFEIISENPRICLQVEEVVDLKNWASVIVDGEAEELASDEDRERALQLITRHNPSLTPAMSIHWMDGWIRENISVFYRITPLTTTGRATVPGSELPETFTTNPTEGKVF